VTPQRVEQAIPEFRKEVASYDPASSRIIEDRFLGHLNRIPVTERVQTSRIYYGRIKLDDGREVLGWIGIPQDPYVVAYARATGRRVMP
jgi:hypothetical protein